MTAANELECLRARATLRRHGTTYEQFRLGQVFLHKWARTLTESDNVLFTTLTLGYNALYFDQTRAGAAGHRAVVVNPMLVFALVFGLSVEDLSEGSLGSRPESEMTPEEIADAPAAFLGVDKLTFHAPVYPGDTLRARSTVTGLRTSSKFTGSGIATWHTEGFNADGVRVIDFMRSNMMRLPVGGSAS